MSDCQTIHFWGKKTYKLARYFGYCCPRCLAHILLKDLFPREWARSGFVNDGGNGEPTVLFTPKTVCMTALAALTSSYEEGKRSHSGSGLLRVRCGWMNVSLWGSASFWVLGLIHPLSGTPSWIARTGRSFVHPSGSVRARSLASLKKI